VVGRDEPPVPTLSRSLVAAAALLLAVGLFGAFAPASLHVHLVRALVIATICLSLVVLTGLSGQVSLAQYLFVGVGAFVTGSVFGGASVLGMVLGGLVAAALAVVVALSAVRLRGLHLALSTFGFALIGREAVLGHPDVFGLGGLAVGRPHVLGLSMASDASFATWCAVVFVVFALAIGALRRSRFGRQLTAIRDSEIAAAVLGLRVRRTKTMAFALSGFVAGCAGALYGGLAGAVQGSQFDPVNSLVIVLFAFVGGITTVSGALVAGALFALLSYAEATFSELGGLVFIAVAAAAVGLGRQPTGLAGVAIDAFRRLGAERAVRTEPAHPPAPITPVRPGVPAAQGAG
jgi:branched-chain amino acid transport system permease protein